MGKYQHLTETQYLYGVKVEDFMSLRYVKALEFRLEKGKALYEELYYIEKKDFEDEVRIHRVYKAIKHNEKLLREIPTRLGYVTAIVRGIDVIVTYTIGKLKESLKTAKNLFNCKKVDI